MVSKLQKKTYHYALEILTYLGTVYTLTNNNNQSFTHDIFNGMERLRTRYYWKYR